MDDELIMMLDDEIKAELENLNSLECGSKEHSEAVEDLTKLYKLRIEDSKAGVEYIRESENEQYRREQAEKQAELNVQNQKVQLSEQRIDRIFKVGTILLEVGIPLIFYNKWTKKGFEFEQEGTIASSTFKDIIRNRFKRK